MTTLTRWLGVVSVFGACVAACGEDTDVPAGTAGSGGSGVGGGTGGAAGDAGSGGAFDASLPPPTCHCNELEECFDSRFCVAKSVPVPGGYSIDATEVTVWQWEAWKHWGDHSVSDQPDYCQWNTQFHGPDTTCVGDLVPVYGPDPVMCVNWCDAYAYCKAVGKRLCGKIGGGPVAFGAATDATQSQWYNACSSGGLYAYPYGDEYSDTACTGHPVSIEVGTTPVATMPKCQSSVPGYEGVYDLSGNIWEWTDSCDASTGDRDQCVALGGDFTCGGVAQCMRCDTLPLSWQRGERADFLGFRCCSL